MLEDETTYSCIGVLSRNHNTLLDVVFNSDVQPTVGLTSKYAPTSMDHMFLPAEKESMFTGALIWMKAYAMANSKWKLDNDSIHNEWKEQHINQHSTNL